MRRKVFVVAAVVVFVGIFFWIEHSRITPSKDTEISLSNETEQTSSTSSTLNQKESTDSSSSEQTDVTPSDKELELLNNFGEKWINYETIYDRNQGVKEYLTEKAIRANSIDVDPHVESKGSGEVTMITQDIKNRNQYLLTAKEKVNGNINDVVISIQLNYASKKIESFNVLYVRNVY